MQHARKRKQPEAIRSVRKPAAPPAAPLSLLPRLAADIFQRMTDEEKLEFLRLVGAEFLEEWLATLEVADDPQIQEALRQAEEDKRAGRETEVPL